MGSWTEEVEDLISSLINCNPDNSNVAVCACLQVINHFLV